MNLGVALPIDSFGTGYPSTTYLESLPVDALGTDRSMVEGSGEVAETWAVVSTTTGLAMRWASRWRPREWKPRVSYINCNRWGATSPGRASIGRGRAPPRNRRSYWRPVRTRSRNGALGSSGASAPLAMLAAAQYADPSAPLACPLFSRHTSHDGAQAREIFESWLVGEVIISELLVFGPGYVGAYLVGKSRSSPSLRGQRPHCVHGGEP
jgi:hypothetical protein